MGVSTHWAHVLVRSLALDLAVVAALVAQLNVLAGKGAGHARRKERGYWEGDISSSRPTTGLCPSSTVSPIMKCEL